jgi:hypothetical protein
MADGLDYSLQVVQSGYGRFGNHDHVGNTGYGRGCRTADSRCSVYDNYISLLFFENGDS